MKSVVIIGYSGHSYVILDLLKRLNRQVVGYLDMEEKMANPYGLKYLGSEDTPDGLAVVEEHDYFVCLGHNGLRKKILNKLFDKTGKKAITLIHPVASIASTVRLGSGTAVFANASINSMAQIGEGVVCNTACVIEHECQVGDYAHIAPGAVLAGNVKVGENVFIGANAAVIQGLEIKQNAIVGAGSVVINHVAENVTVAGNPAKVIASSERR